ncbi:MAG: hypothetical protein M1818_003970 [Claussenomyces sp. TS43310]|nr:MAG: hypothetical protein M1818_003970 [Claussenomyces sp. TS43310]
MARGSAAALLLLLLVCLSAANVEKVIFLGPAALQISSQSPSLANLKLLALSPEHSSLRTELSAGFPSEETVDGPVSWMLLEGLAQGQRYEVRICYAATQPTSFRMSIFELPQVLKTPDLISSLARYSETRQLSMEDEQMREPSIHEDFKIDQQKSDVIDSVLLLQISAAADYFTTNKTLMKVVPPVLVDVILDPYALNVLPRSLIPTSLYLLILAIGSWYLAKLVCWWLQSIAVEGNREQQKQNKKKV